MKKYLLILKHAKMEITAELLVADTTEVDIIA